MRCHAPFTSLYLDQRGFARVCPVNNAMPLGNVGRSTLREIWHGQVATELRQRFLSGRWAEGCDVCAWQSAATTEDQVYARLYDELPMPDGPPEWPVHLEMALSNRCNLQCVMCSGDQSSSIRQHREGFEPLPDAYPDRFFDELAEVIPHLQRAKFLGGEPFLVRGHHRVWDLMVESGAEVPIHVTTNGTIWNERVERVLEHLPTSLAISFDGLQPDTIRKVRVGADPDVLFANLYRFQDYVRRRGTYLSLTFCLMTENWREFGDFLVWAAGRELDVFVNTVVNPAPLSLYRLPSAELRALVATLEQQDQELRAHLGQNLPIWDDQLARLRARVHGEGGDELPRWLQRAADRSADLPEEAWVTIGSRRSEEVRESDRAVLLDWVEGGPLAVIDLDADDVVVRVEPSTGTFLDVPSDLVGLTFDEVAMLLSSFYGRRTLAEQLPSEPPVEDRTARYETAHGYTDLRTRSRPVTLEAGGRGVRLVIGARPAHERAPSGP